MRLWTLHPKYLDPQGLVACWRETLLAQKVLQGKTAGYKAHPQLTRFRAQTDPVASAGQYLAALHREALRRGYSFNAAKIAVQRKVKKIIETDGQLQYEWQHLKRKLRLRNPAIYRKVRGLKFPQAHPLFRIVPGEVRDWERPR